MPIYDRTAKAWVFNTERKLDPRYAAPPSGRPRCRARGRVPRCRRITSTSGTTSRRAHTTRVDVGQVPTLVQQKVPVYDRTAKAWVFSTEQQLDPRIRRPGRSQWDQVSGAARPAAPPAAGLISRRRGGCVRQRFGCRASSLDVEAALSGGGRRAARDPRAWPHEGCGDQPANLGRASSILLAWLRVAWLVTTRRPAASSRCRARACRRTGAPSDSPSMACQIHAQLHLGGHLVHVLAARTGGSHGPQGERPAGHPHGIGDGDRLAHAVILAALIGCTWHRERIIVESKPVTVEAT